MPFRRGSRVAPYRGHRVAGNWQRSGSYRPASAQAHPGMEISFGAAAPPLSPYPGTYLRSHPALLECVSYPTYLPLTLHTSLLPCIPPSYPYPPPCVLRASPLSSRRPSPDPGAGGHPPRPGLVSCHDTAFVFTSPRGTHDKTRLHKAPFVPLRFSSRGHVRDR